jgi:hypothetical protein
MLLLYLIVLIFKEFSSQTLSSRIDRNTEFKFLQLEGEIDKDVIKNIENVVDIKNLKNFIMRQFVDFKYRIW